MLRVLTIVTIVGVLVLGLLTYNSNRVKSPYSREAAQEDIEAGDVKRYSVGLSVLRRIPMQQLDSLRIIYGFRDVNLGCFTNHSLENDINEYNAVTNDYLKKRNGVNWEKLYYNDVFRMAGAKRVNTPLKETDFR